MKRKIATIQKTISLVETEKGMESYTAILIDLYRATVSFRRCGKERWTKCNRVGVKEMDRDRYNFEFLYDTFKYVKI